MNANRILKDAIDEHFPHIALVASDTPEDRVLIDLVVRVNPDVRIFRLGREIRGLLTEEAFARQRGLHAVIDSRRAARPVERARGLIRIHPLAEAV